MEEPVTDDYIIREHILALNASYILTGIESGCPYCGDADTEEKILVRHKQIWLGNFAIALQKFAHIQLDEEK